MYIRKLTLIILSSFIPVTGMAMNYGDSDRQSTNVEDRRPESQARECEAAKEPVKQACVANMDGIRVQADGTGAGYQEGIDRGLANIAATRTDAQKRWFKCLEAYGKAKQTCDQAKEHALMTRDGHLAGEKSALEARALSVAESEKSNAQIAQEALNRIDKSNDELQLVYGIGSRKYDASTSALSNSEIQLINMRPYTGGQ